jgi:uncharacterized protein (DUF4213/DUF364 family)
VEIDMTQLLEKIRTAVRSHTQGYIGDPVTAETKQILLNKTGVMLTELLTGSGITVTGLRIEDPDRVVVALELPVSLLHQPDAGDQA